MNILEKRKSICPVCMRLVDANIVERNSDVFLEKSCPEHGSTSTLIWRGDLPSWSSWNSPRVEYSNMPEPLTQTSSGCPYDCGLCPGHNAHTCSVLLEVTERCNMKCPICFAQAQPGLGADVSISKLEEHLNTIIRHGGPYPLQLSGGEPTVRDDLPDIIRLAKSMGFPHVQVNTNGIRIAQDPIYLNALVEAGLDLVYLQLDGISDAVYQRLRGRPLADTKRQAIVNCSEAKVGVQFVPVIIRGVNDHEIGDIVRLAKEFMPTVKGIHFQPASYFGRYEIPPSNDTRETLPDIFRAIEQQTNGEISVGDFLPRQKHDAHCGFSAFYILTQNGVLKPTTHFDPAAERPAGDDSITPAEHVRDFITNRSRYIEDAGEPGECECMRAARLSKSLLRAKKYGLSISGMPFMDCWTLDTERLKNCCIHVCTSDGRIVPFCAYYVTSCDGQRLPQFR